MARLMTDQDMVFTQTINGGSCLSYIFMDKNGFTILTEPIETGPFFMCGDKPQPIIFGKDHDGKKW